MNGGGDPGGTHGRVPMRDGEGCGARAVGAERQG